MAKKTITGLVTNVKRVGTSVNGNPSYDVTISTPTEGFPGEITLRTMSDSMLAYGIGNAEYRDVPHIFGLTAANRLDGTAEKVGY